MIANTTSAVPDQTSPQANAAIRQEMDRRIAAYRGADRDALIDMRLQELDREWDVERLLQTNFSVLTLISLALATQASRKWLFLAAGIPAFMLQHSLQGWCPPLPLLRKLGVRTAKEINEERFALQAIRGDFDRQDAAGLASAVRH